MLRRAHVEPFAPVRDGEVVVSFLLADPRRLRFMERLTRLARRLEGRPRRVVAEALRRQERRIRDASRLRGITKALLDACAFAAPEGAARAPEVRAALFRARSRRWPPRPGDARAPYADAAAELGTTPEEVDRLLYADSPAERVLLRAPRLDGAALLDLYNLELARGVLLGAVRVTLTAEGEWGGVFRALKLARLMYRVFPVPRGGYSVEVTGPAAPYLARPEVYGSRLARVVPVLTRAPGWRLEAEVTRRGRTYPFRLDASTAPFRARRGRVFDSGWERALADEFAEKLGAERAGWTLVREERPVPIGDEVFLPDFTLRHADGREALVELVGFWTPEYLREKLRKVRAAGVRNLVLVVYRKLRTGAAWADAPGEVVWFATRPRIKPVLEAAARVAGR